MTERIAIIGAGDLGRTIFQHATSAGFEVKGFYDDTCPGSEVMGKPVFGLISDLHERDGWDSILIAIGYKHLRFRKSLFEQMAKRGVPLATLIHPSCYVDPSAEVGSGTILFPRCVIDANVVVDTNCVLNAGCVIAHDSFIGPHSFFGPGVTISGFVRTEECCFFGTGTILIDNLSVGPNTQTGAGAVVVDTFSGGLLLGVPAKNKN